MFMWNRSRQTPQSPSNLGGQRESLVTAVDEVRLEAVERLDRETDPERRRVLLALPERLHTPTPLGVR